MRKEREEEKQEGSIGQLPITKEIGFTIDGVYIPLTIEAEDEKLYRSAADRFSELVMTYREDYRTDKEVINDKLYRLMAGFEMAVSCKREEIKNDIHPIEDRLQTLCTSVENYLQEQEQDEFWQMLLERNAWGD